MPNLPCYSIFFGWGCDRGMQEYVCVASVKKYKKEKLLPLTTSFELDFFVITKKKKKKKCTVFCTSSRRKAFTSDMKHSNCKKPAHFSEMFLQKKAVT